MTIVCIQLLTYDHDNIFTLVSTLLRSIKTMPGHKVFLQDGGEIRDGLACSYCKLLLKDPVQTSESGQRLCKECFEVAIKLVYC